MQHMFTSLTFLSEAKYSTLNPHKQVSLSECILLYKQDATFSEPDYRSESSPHSFKYPVLCILRLWSDHVCVHVTVF